ncbi:MAG: hypothetical protein ABLQ96_12490 [Candidatus Acidiferrum sp.]
MKHPLGGHAESPGDFSFRRLEYGPVLHTYYAITDRRAFILQEGWKRKSVSAFPNEISIIVREGNQRGTLWLGTKYPIFGPRGAKKRSMSRSMDEVPVFADIDDVDAVHRLLIEPRSTGKRADRPIFSFPG